MFKLISLLVFVIPEEVVLIKHTRSFGFMQDVYHFQKYNYRDFSQREGRWANKHEQIN